MRKLELSIDENNTAAAIRDAVIEAEPTDCHGCPTAFERTYKLGQLARMCGFSPEMISADATALWSEVGACCGKSEVYVETVQPEPEMPAGVEKALVSV